MGSRDYGKDKEAQQSEMHTLPECLGSAKSQSVTLSELPTSSTFSCLHL